MILWNEMLKELGFSPPSVRFRRPVPLEYSQPMSGKLGVDFYLKREDLFDDVGSGHKQRKLSFVIQDAIKKNADVLLTCASVPSSQCVAVASAALMNNMDSHIVYLGDTQKKPDSLRGNYLLTLLQAGNVTWFEERPWRDYPDALAEVSQSLTSEGRRPYSIPPGIMLWPGILGSIDLGIELASEISNRNFPSGVNHVVSLFGSGATCLGLRIGAGLAGVDLQVHGITISEGTDSAYKQLRKLHSEVSATFPASVDNPGLPSQVHIYPNPCSSPYDQPGSEELEEMRICIREFGMLFDPNYMIKAWIGIKRLRENGIFAPGDRIVLVHTGGSYGIFGSTSAMMAWFMSEYSDAINAKR